MAVSFKPAIGVLVPVAAGAPATAPLALPENCHTLIIYNPSASDVALMGFAQDALSFVAADAVRIPPGAAVTLAISARGGRSQIQGDEPFYDITAGAETLYVTYVNASSL